MAVLPNSMSFRLVSTRVVTDLAEIPDGFTGRVVVRDDHGPREVRWLDRGQLDDPADDVPAVVRYRDDGTVKQERCYRLGRLHDPRPGVAAVRGFFADGSRKYEEHFRYGWRQDVDGRAAITKWRTDGSVRAVRHYVEDRRVDASDRTDVSGRSAR